MKKEVNKFKIQILNVTETTMTVGLSNYTSPLRRDSDLNFPIIKFQLMISDFAIRIIKKLNSSDSMMCTIHTKTILNAEDRLIKFHRAYNRILLNANADLSS